MQRNTGSMAVFLIVVMVAINGCSRHTVVPPAPEPPGETLPEVMPAVPSKGGGMKKRLPVPVRTGDRLGWVDNALRTYSPDRFLSGLGIAPDRKTAERRAWTELNKPFTLTLDGRIKIGMTAMGTLPHSSAQELGRLAVKSRESAIASALSQGRVAEIFIEAGSSQTIYALVVLDRQLCADHLMPLIQRLDDQLKEITVRLEKAGKPMAPTDRGVLVESFFRREALDAALATAGPAGKGIPPPVQPKRIGRLLRKK